MTNQRARARSHSHAHEQAIIDALEHCVASAAVTDLIEALRASAFSDPYIAASLLAGAKSLVRGMPDRKPFAALLKLMASEAASER